MDFIWFIQNGPVAPGFQANSCWKDSFVATKMSSSLGNMFLDDTIAQIFVDRVTTAVFCDEPYLTALCSLISEHVRVPKKI